MNGKVEHEAQVDTYIIAIGWPYSLRPRLNRLRKCDVIDMRTSSSRVNCCSMSARIELILSVCSAVVAGMVDIVGQLGDLWTSVKYSRVRREVFPDALTDPSSSWPSMDSSSSTRQTPAQSSSPPFAHFHPHILFSISTHTVTPSQRLIV